MVELRLHMKCVQISYATTLIHAKTVEEAVQRLEEMEAEDDWLWNGPDEWAEEAIDFTIEDICDEDDRSLGRSSKEVRGMLDIET